MWSKLSYTRHIELKKITDLPLWVSKSTDTQSEISKAQIREDSKINNNLHALPFRIYQLTHLNVEFGVSAS